MSKEKNDIDNTTNEDSADNKTNKAETKIVVSPAQVSLEKLAQCNDVIIGSATELVHLVKDMEKLAGDTKEFNNLISESVKSLHGQTYILRKLPEKMQEGLRAIVPEVGKEIQTIHTDLLTTFNDNIKICHDNLKLLSDEAQKFITKQQDLANVAMEQLVEKSTRISKLCIQKTWITMLVVTVVSAIVSAAGCYFTLASMPSPYDVTINDAKNIYIDKSPVAIWGDKGLNIYKPEKK
jgi:hypothetical protein